MSRIGLVAGFGKLPIIFSNIAKQKGDTVIAFALKGVTYPQLGDHVAKIHWLEWGNLKMSLLLLAAERIQKIAMLGKVNKDIFFKDDSKFDDDARKIFEKIKDKKDYAIFNEVSAALSKLGIEVLDSTVYLKCLLPAKGTLTKREPTKDESADINYGRQVASALAEFDIGQTVAVREKTIIAVEAVEGTDEAIKRAGGLTNGGFVVVKVARPNQDMRFDVPLVGLDTLKVLIESGGKALALEEKKTFLMDREDLINLADAKGISVVVI